MTLSTLQEHLRDQDHCDEQMRFIVLFSTKIVGPERQAALKQKLAADVFSCWVLVERNNPARLIPSDFIVLAFDATSSPSNTCGCRRGDGGHDDLNCVHALQSALQATFPDFKSITSDSPIRSIKAIDDSEDNEVLLGSSRSFRLFEESTTSWDAIDRHPLGFEGTDAIQKLQVNDLWQLGNEGQGVRIAVFDTGLHSTTPNIAHIEERTDWTTDGILDDTVGHGSFVASLIAGTRSSGCGGVAPQASILSFRVFNSKQKSYTSWFLDAFNYAMFRKVHVINMSIGGPDHSDQPFVDKINEVSAQGIVIVSANGNEGPLYGTTNNPADQVDVIGVGGIQSAMSLSPFSSRGMTLWETPHGYGRVKPDLVTWSRRLFGSKHGALGGCKTLSGTSVAAPVVAGAVALLISAMARDGMDPSAVNVASMKQLLLPSANRIHGRHIFEQGAGSLDIQGAEVLQQTFVPHVSFVPPQLELNDCPYMWPHCTQPLFYTSMPIVFNVTILNSMGVSSVVVNWTYNALNHLGSFVQVDIVSPMKVWPWTGHLGVVLTVSSDGFDAAGEAQGVITVAVETFFNGRPSEITYTQLPITVTLVPTPPRHKRILFSHFHSITYPRAFAPRDDLQDTSDLLDWHGDHLHTNFHHLYMQLRKWGYFVEGLGSDLLCFDASLYGTLMIVDPELAFSRQEVEKLQLDVQTRGLGLVVFADWHSFDVLKDVQFVDDNTRARLIPITGGSNNPGLNGLLQPFGISLSDNHVYAGTTLLANLGLVEFSSGSSITAFPANGMVFSGKLRELSVYQSLGSVIEVPILGLMRAGAGRVAVFTDSGCIDDAHQTAPCFGMVKHILEFSCDGLVDPVVFPNHLTTPKLPKLKQQPAVTFAPRPPASPFDNGRCGIWTNLNHNLEELQQQVQQQVQQDSSFTSFQQQQHQQQQISDETVSRGLFAVSEFDRDQSVFLEIDPSLYRDLSRLPKLPDRKYDKWALVFAFMILGALLGLRATFCEDEDATATDQTSQTDKSGGVVLELRDQEDGGGVASLEGSMIASDVASIDSTTTRSVGTCDELLS